MNQFKRLQAEFETKARKGIRHVRTPEGMRKYGQPIGSVIVPDPVPNVTIGAGKGRRALMAPNTPHEMGTPSPKAKPAAPVPDGASEVPTDYPGTRKFRIGRRVFYSWENEPGDWVLTDTRDNVLHDGSTEEEALSGLKKFFPKDHSSDSSRTKKTLGKFRPASEDDLAVLREKHKVLVPPAYRSTAQVHDQDDFWNHEPVVQWTDSNGKLQSRYSPAHTERAKHAKFQRVKELSEHIGELDEHLEREWRNDERAAVLYLIRKTGMRPSSADNARGNVVSYGATTIQARHVTINQETVRLKFDGKKGVGQDHTYRDAELVELFTQYKGDKTHRSEIFPNVTPPKLNLYIKEVTGKDFQVKDLRTLLGTTMARMLMQSYGTPKNATEFKKWRNEIADQVSDSLGNTRSVALGSYIDPGVFDAWAQAVGED